MNADIGFVHNISAWEQPSHLQASEPALRAWSTPSAPTRAERAQGVAVIGATRTALREISTAGNQVSDQLPTPHDARYVNFRVSVFMDLCWPKMYVRSEVGPERYGIACSNRARSGESVRISAQPRCPGRKYPSAQGTAGKDTESFLAVHLVGRSHLPVHLRAQGTPGQHS